MTHENFEEQLRELIASGNKIQAIKLYREETGVGLAEAKDAVEALAAGETLPAGDVVQDRVAVDDSELTDEVVSLLGQGKPLPAIKLVRERTGQSLKQAKETVDQIGVDNGLAAQSGSGCLGMILLGIVGSLVIGQWILFA